LNVDADPVDGVGLAVIGFYDILEAQIGWRHTAIP
jgi:hypothetical protein